MAKGEKTLWNPRARTELLHRFRRLDPAATPIWGKFNAPQMLQHCIGGVGMFIGEKKIAPRKTLLGNRLVRHLVIHWLPWPKGVPTAPELLEPPTAGWATLLDELEAVMERAAARGAAGSFDPHPAFGQLDGADVGALIHRHLDHHLTQFGA